MIRIAILAAAVVSLTFSGPVRADATPLVRIMRVPDGGVQPQVAVDEKGIVHLIYLHGDPAHSDVFYIRSTDEGQTFSRPLRVNSQAGSAIAVGTVRGAHLAIGRGGRVHVAWMGSSQAEPKGPDKSSPMLYTRISDDGTGFEPQRNLIRSKPGLDGGASVAADEKGDVWVAWHAPTQKGAGEATRTVWLVHSSEDGKTFGSEEPLSDTRTGACGCCGMRLFSTPDGKLYALYRTATETIHRDMTVLERPTQGEPVRAQRVGPMNIATCIMSTSAFAQSPQGVLGAWETAGQISWANLDAKEIKSVPAPGTGNNRKHPALAVNAQGEILLVWTEGTGWNKGGSVAWQVYDPSGKPRGQIGRAEGLPVWGSPAAFARKDGTFVVVY